MNVLKKQLRLPSSFSGMKKAVSTTNLSDNYFQYLDGSNHNLTLDSRLMKSKSPSLVAQLSMDITETLQTLSNVILDKSTRSLTEDFIGDELPMTLSTKWLDDKCTADVSKQMQQKTSAIMELLTTELNYLNQMQFLLDISTKVFTQIQSRYFSYIQIEDVFLNLGDIYEVNYSFWSTYLYPSYQNALNNNEFISTKVWKGFKEMTSLFFPYQIYCAKMNQCQKFIQSLEKENKCFSKFSQWFSHLDPANRESLTDFIAKPFQRLTKYKLLLTTIGKFSDDYEEQQDIEEMVNSVNLFLKQVELKISIAQISMRIDPIEIVEPPTDDLLELCAPYRNVDLTTPIHTFNGEIIREIKKECIFKLKEAQTKVIEVTCLLFTDLILICQKIKNHETDRIKIIRPIISLKKLDMLNPLPGAIVIRIIDDFGCLTAMYLLTNESTIIKEWVEAIIHAKNMLKDINPVHQLNDTKMYLKPRLNVISSSPIPEEKPNNPLPIDPVRSISPSTRTLNRAPASCNTSFMRCNFRSSPVVRKRINSVAKRNHLSLSEEQSPHNDIYINRSLSQQHSAKSHLSILENEFDQPFMSDNSSLYCNDVQSSNLSIQSVSNENLDVTLSEKQINNLNSVKDSFSPNVKVLVDYDASSNLKGSRAYKSMVNRTVDS